jgi:CRP-like cAMP-binding protein
MPSKEITLKSKDILFEEGDQSKNMYLIKAGAIRIFKRKGDGKIEIETLRSGQVVGELSFFDGQTRSASAEALVTTEVIEITRAALDAALNQAPEWLVTLIKTITSRLRGANNRIRILENISTEYDIDKHGNRTKEYTYVTMSELLRFCTGLLTVASRYGKNQSSEGIEFSSGMLEKFGAQILQVPSAKVVSLIEVFKSVEILKGDLVLTDIRFLDQLIQFLNDQNLTAHEKRQEISLNGFKVLTSIVQNRGEAVSIADGIERLNIGPAIKIAAIPLSFAQELLDQGFIKNITLVSGEEILVDYNGSDIIFMYRAFWLLTELEKLNIQKRKN